MTANVDGFEALVECGQISEDHGREEQLHSGPFEGNLDCAVVYSRMYKAADDRSCSSNVMNRWMTLICHSK